jgi:hypothetical protein
VKTNEKEMFEMDERVSDEIMKEVNKIVEEAIDNGDITENDIDTYDEALDNDEDLVKWVGEEGINLVIEKLGISKDDNSEVDDVTAAKFAVLLCIEGIKYLKARYIS